VSDEQAAQLSSGLKYSITGTVKAWDKNDVLQVKPWHLTPNDQYMGIFIAEDMQVTEFSE
jgi:hypothetical protein